MSVTNSLFPPTIHESWYPYLELPFKSFQMEALKNKILPSCKFYPEGSEIFNVFKMPIDRIKVVVVGQDPYSRGEAIGYSFAVKEGVNEPASLNVIRNEIINSKVERDNRTNIDAPQWKTLKHWREQGVFLLNAALTVEAKIPDSHIAHWQWFTSGIIQVVSAIQTPVWMLWGSKARNLAKPNIVNIKQYDPTLLVDSRYNYYISAPHPAAEKYSTQYGTFSGSNVFNLCNQILKQQGKTIINW